MQVLSRRIKKLRCISKSARTHTFMMTSSGAWVKYTFSSICLYLTWGPLVPFILRWILSLLKVAMVTARESIIRYGEVTLYMQPGLHWPTNMQINRLTTVCLTCTCWIAHQGIITIQLRGQILVTIIYKSIMQWTHCDHNGVDMQFNISCMGPPTKKLHNPVQSILETVNDASDPFFVIASSLLANCYNKTYFCDR